MNLIAIETSTENCSVALLNQGSITKREEIAPRKHAELVLSYIDELLAEQGLKKHQIEGIVFGQGPGAFTGVRIAMSIVQGLALAWDVPVLAVSTMHNMAFQISLNHRNKHQKILIANDARMGEVYWASFKTENGQLLRLSEDALNAPKNIKTAGFDVCAGSAFQTMIAAPDGVIISPDALPTADALLALAQEKFTNQARHINDIKPSYIRENVVFN